jgi:hypothetical protein
MEERRRTLQCQHFIGSLKMIIECGTEPGPDACALLARLDDPDGAKAVVLEWHDVLMNELDPKKAKYASAIRRITGAAATYYHALAYRDFPVLQDLWPLLDWAVPLGIPALVDDADTRNDIIRTLSQMSEFSRIVCDCELAVPSRSDISANIQAHRTTKHPQKPTMARGFDAMLDDVMNQLGCTHRLANNVERAPLWMKETQDETLASAIKNKDLQSFKAHTFAHYEFAAIFACVDEKTATDAFWGKLNTMHSFAGVQTGIPSNMMSKIESTAHKLAGEIATGKTDMSSLNIADIGRSVLQDVDPSDMESFSANMGSLLPMLGNLQCGLSAHMPKGLSAE